MFSFLFGKDSIRVRVFNVINARIKAAEEKFSSLCKIIDDEAEDKKNEAATQLVTDILGR